MFRDLVPALIEEYHFKTFPQVGGDFKDGMKFENGSFTNGNGDVLPIKLTVFHDGLAADTYSATRDSDQFLEEVLGMLPELGFAYDPSMVRRKAYTSQLHVKCQRQLDQINPKLEAFARRISEVLGWQLSFGFAAIEFWPDPRQALKPANFSFQKRTGEELSSDRYWTQAPLPTDDHLRLLEELEEILLAVPS